MSSPSFLTLVGLRTLAEATLSALGDEQGDNFVSWKTERNGSNKHKITANRNRLMGCMECLDHHIERGFRSQLTWLKFCDSRPNALYDAGSLVPEDCWEAFFVHALEQMIQVRVAHPSRHNLHPGQQPVTDARLF